MGYLAQIEIEFKDRVPKEFSSLDKLKELIDSHILKTTKDYYISLYNYRQEDILSIYFELYCEGKRNHFDWELDNITELLSLWIDKIEDVRSSSYIDCDSVLNLESIQDKLNSNNER